MKKPRITRLLLIIILSIFIAETFVMLCLNYFFPPISSASELLIDSTMLVVILAPVFYNFIYLPMQKSMQCILDSEIVFRTVIQTTVDGFCLTDVSSGNFLDANEAYCSMIGYSKEELLRMKITDVEAYESSEETKKHIENILKTGHDRFETRHKTKSGKLIDVEVRVTYSSINEGRLYVFIHDITGRKKAAKALIESEKLFRVFYNETPIMMHSINQTGELLLVSDYWLQKLGYQREEVVGKKISSFLSETSRKYATETIQPQFIRSGHINNVEYCFVKKNGEMIDCLLSAISQRDKNKNFIRSLAVITDITERKQIEKALQQSETNLRAIFENTATGFLLLDTEFNIISSNECAKAILKVALGSKCENENNLFKMLPPERKQPFLDNNRKVLQGETIHYQVPYPQNDGSDVWFEVNSKPVIDDKNSVIGISFSITDITERKKMIQELSESGTRNRLLLETMMEGVLYVNNEDVVQFANNRFCEMLGYAPDELWGKVAGQVIVLDEENRKKMKEVTTQRKQGIVSGYEIEWIKKTGEKICFHINGAPVKDEQRNIIGSLGILTDITERKKSFEKLVKAESRIRNFAKHLNRMIEEERADIAREIHDELGQQLVGIKMKLSSLKSPTIKGEKTENTITLFRVGVLDDMIKEVDDTIQSLRKIATALRPGILDSLGLIPSIVWLGSEFEKKTNIQCTVIVSGQPSMGSGQWTTTNEQLLLDKEISICFFRICQEALTNVSKHAGASEVTIRITQTKTELLLKISDNGKGIVSEKLENPFSMGLLGMRERANIIGADLNITSEKEKGTTVQIKANIAVSAGNI